jgi:hypothetical protein
MPTTDLLQSLGLLAAVLFAICAPIIWLAVRSGKAPAAAAALAQRHGLRAQPAPHRRMRLFTGEVDGFAMEIVVHGNIFDRYPPAAIGYGATRSLAIRLIRPEPLGTPFLVENVPGVENQHAPAPFGLHPIFKLRTTRPEWLRRLLAEPNVLRLLNGFQEPATPRPHVISALNEHGAVAWLSEPTPDVAVQVTGELLTIMRRLRERHAFMP